MARSKHLQIYRDAYRFTRELYRVREKLPKTLKYGLGEMAFASALRMVRGIVVANGSKNKISPLQIVSLEIEVQWVFLRMMLDFKGISRSEFQMLSEILYELSKQNQNWKAWAKKVDKEDENN